MTYSEEEIQKYLNILQNVNDSLNVVSLIKDDHIPPKTPEKLSCENCGNTHFFQRWWFQILQEVFSISWPSFYQRNNFQRSMLFQTEMRLQERISLSK